MKGLRITDDEISCLIGDAILHEDDLYSRIKGNGINGFIVESPQKIGDIEEKGWSELYASLEDNNENYSAIAGETSWGGAGFVALKDLKYDSFKWVIHLTNMNNPIKISIEQEIVRLTTDLNYPDGIDFIIPIIKPENFKIKRTETNNL